MWSGGGGAISDGLAARVSPINPTPPSTGRRSLLVLLGRSRLCKYMFKIQSQLLYPAPFKSLENVLQ